MLYKRYEKNTVTKVDCTALCSFPMLCLHDMTILGKDAELSWFRRIFSSFMPICNIVLFIHFVLMANNVCTYSDSNSSGTLVH